MHFKFILLLLPILFFTACTTNNPPQSSEPISSAVVVSHGGEVKDQVSFMDTLRSKNIEVQIGDSIEQPFLRAKGTQLTLSGGSIATSSQIQAFNYDDIKAAQDDAAQIDFSGNHKTSNIMWVGGPH